MINIEQRIYISLLLSRFEYLWKDSKDYKSPAKLPAPEYIDMLMSWVEEQLNDPSMFPTQECMSPCMYYAMSCASWPSSSFFICIINDNKINSINFCDRIFTDDDHDALGTSYPRGFLSNVKNIFRRLFRVYAHVYYSHFDKIVCLGAEAHLNSCFKHFILFVTEFDLVEAREQEPLKDLIQNLIR